jgi:hypothetical protein
VVAGNSVPVLLLESDASDLTLEVATVASLVEKAATDVNNADIDPAVVSVFSSICEAMRGICKVQDKIVTASLRNKTVTNASTMQDYVQPNNMVSLGAIPKRPRVPVSLSQPNPVPQSGGSVSRRDETIPVGKVIPPTGNVTKNAPQKQSAPEIDPEVRRFKDAIRDAERSTLVLNLNLGRIPIMNKDTLAKKATLALTAAAATKQKSKTSVPNAEAVAAIDDVLSIVKNYSFYGTCTKTYKNQRDELSGS